MSDMRTVGEPHRLRLLASWTLLSVLLTGTLALLARPPFNPDTSCCDHLYYRSMSYNLFTVTRPDLNAPPPGNRVVGDGLYDPLNGLSRQPPYVYRVLTPLLARSFAFVVGIEAGYYVLAFLAFVGTLLFMALSIYELTGSKIPAAAGAILFLVSPWTMMNNLHHYMLTDPMAFFLTAVAIWALTTRRRALFFVVCALGVLNKESMVPMLIAYPLSEAWFEHRVSRTSIAMTVGIAAGWYLLRRAIPIPHDTYSIPNQFRGGLRHVVLMGVAGLGTFAAILPAAVRRPWRSGLIVALTPFIVACILEAWFVGDLHRTMVQAIPALCVAVLWRWPAQRRQQLLTLAFVPLAVANAIAYAIWGGSAHVRAFSLVSFLTLICAAAAEVSLARLQIVPLRQGQVA
jgi:hypothetical protein